MPAPPRGVVAVQAWRATGGWREGGQSHSHPVSLWFIVGHPMGAWLVWSSLGDVASLLQQQLQTPRPQPGEGMGCLPASQTSHASTCYL